MNERETLETVASALSLLDPVDVPAGRSEQATETPRKIDTRQRRFSNLGRDLHEGPSARKTGVGPRLPLQTPPSGSRP